MSDRQNKREQFQSEPTTGKKWLIPAILLVIAVAAGAGGWLYLAQPSYGHQQVTAGQDGALHFPAAELADGKARFYRFQGKTAEVDFFLVQSHDGVIRAAFDTCDVCYKARKGYRQEGEDMVCNNCDQHFRTDMVNVLKGGCNPAPLDRQKVGQDIIISANDIERGANYFTAAVN